MSIIQEINHLVKQAAVDPKEQEIVDNYLRDYGDPWGRNHEYVKSMARNVFAARKNLYGKPVNYYARYADPKQVATDNREISDIKARSAPARRAYAQKQQDMGFLRRGEMRLAQSGRSPGFGQVRRAQPYGTQTISRNAPVSQVASSDIQPYKAWEDPRWLAEKGMNQPTAPSASRWLAYKNAPSTKMMQNASRRLTADDAYAEIMRRRPGMDPAQARRLAPMVAKNYRTDANGNWVAIGNRPARTNASIASSFRRGFGAAPSNAVTAGMGSRATPAGA